MFMKSKTHRRILADQQQLNQKVFAANLRLARELTEVRRQLARYTAPRRRGAGGRFLPLDRVS